MSNQKKHVKQKIEDGLMDSKENEMLQFAELITETVLERNLSEMEPFEFYAHQLRTHLHSNPEVFKNRFSEGYRVLLEEIEKEPVN